MLVGGIALRTGGFRSGPWPPEFVLTALLLIPLYALIPVVLLAVGPFAYWLLFWIATFFGTCVPPDCAATGL